MFPCRAPLFELGSFHECRVVNCSQDTKTVAGTPQRAGWLERCAMLVSLVWREDMKLLKKVANHFFHSYGQTIKDVAGKYWRANDKWIEKLLN